MQGGEWKRPERRGRQDPCGPGPRVELRNDSEEAGGSETRDVEAALSLEGKEEEPAAASQKTLEVLSGCLTPVLGA